jgi:hypothetical protein
LELLGDLLDRRYSGCDGHDEVVDVLIRRGCHAGVVDLQEDGGGEPAEAPVAVDQRIVVDDRLEQRGGLQPDGRIGILAADAGLRTGHG